MTRKRPASPGGQEVSTNLSRVKLQIPDSCGQIGIGDDYEEFHLPSICVVLCSLASAAVEDRVHFLNSAKDLCAPASAHSNFKFCDFLRNVLKKYNFDAAYRQARVWIGVTQTLTIDMLDDRGRSKVLEVTSQSGEQTCV